jgi:hypothetical protein
MRWRETEDSCHASIAMFGTCDTQRGAQGLRALVLASVLAALLVCLIVSA